MMSKEEKKISSTGEDFYLRLTHNILKKSRKNIFHKIIKKYSRPVKRNDIIDLNRMEVVEDGGYLRHQKSRPFPSVEPLLAKDSTLTLCIKRKEREREAERQVSHTPKKNDYANSKRLKNIKKKVPNGLISTFDKKLPDNSKIGSTLKNVDKNFTPHTYRELLSPKIITKDRDVTLFVNKSPPRKVKPKVALDFICTFQDSSLYNSKLEWESFICNTATHNKKLHTLLKHLFKIK